jgi:hypothetical protein
MSPRITQAPISTLILDFSLYPRHDVDKARLSAMSESYHAGAKFPPVIADSQSKQVIDGFHRVRTYQRHLEPDAAIAVEFRTYANDASRFADAMALNSEHGLALTPYDKARCLQRSEELGLSVETVAAALQMTVDKIQDMRLKKLAIAPTTKLTKGKKPVAMPIRRTISHLAGKQLTEKQYEAHKHTNGAPQLLTVNQLINLVEGDLLDQDNEVLMGRLCHLSGLLLDFCSGT